MRLDFNDTLLIYDVVQDILVIHDVPGMLSVFLQHLINFARQNAKDVYIKVCV